jgi:hypothetical protein
MADFTLQQKISRMISKSSVWINNMQKPDKFVVGEEIRRSEWYMLRMAILGNAEKGSKRPYQKAMDKELAVLRGFIDLAVQPENHLISPGAHGEWTEMLDEIGRILGGWIKRTT